ncbi:hypothetical protein P7K49_004975 [Saguinus oedipus]|uniref:Uncharacterized protein n=1 Tax=Saguinus oedipus TaxID=9490 RepID=A0ABQ9WBE4_SAGOE|nr:hypothetical protein P7K49_004975 [Saguinus oedipus]
MSEDREGRGASRGRGVGAWESVPPTWARVSERPARLFRACARATGYGRGKSGNESRWRAAPPAAPSFPAKCSRRTDSHACPWRESPHPPRAPAPRAHAHTPLAGHVRKTKLGLRVPIAAPLSCLLAALPSGPEEAEDHFLAAQKKQPGARARARTRRRAGLPRAEGGEREGLSCVSGRHYFCAEAA